MVNSSTDGSLSARLALSALMDGDAHDRGAAAIGAWRDDADARTSWHAYHLIGDVLRSDDLAVTPAHDERFLRALRERLAVEPVPLAPSPLPTAGRPVAQAEGGQDEHVAPAGATHRRAASWLMAPAAVAAGFVAVAGILVVTRSWTPGVEEGGVMAQAAASAPVSADGLVASSDVVRNARLDRYLEAHRALGNGVAAAGGAGHRVQIVFESK
jgi:sigma-E factor negative regulatory protein RseA